MTHGVTRSELTLAAAGASRRMGRWPRAGGRRRALVARRMELVAGALVRCSCAVGRGRQRCIMALLDDAQLGEAGWCSASPCPSGSFPSVGALHPPALRAASAPSATCSACVPKARPTARPWLDHGQWRVRYPLGTGGAASAHRRGLSDSAGRRRGPAPDRGRPGACRHHRARSFPLHRQWRDRGAARGAARLRAQGHRCAC
ncbi:MAG: hypothetical protein MZV49_26380 [Rhodopseudomonas palustris]|nr:hypothetical protein [Rhodopseudomonas palustris]